MKKSIHKAILAISLITAICLLSACGSTRSENGVMIEQNRSYNPLDYIPGI